MLRRKSRSDAHELQQFEAAFSNIDWSDLGLSVDRDDRATAACRAAVLEAWCFGRLRFAEKAKEDVVSLARVTTARCGGQASGTAGRRLAQVLATCVKLGFATIVDSDVERRREVRRAAFCLAADVPELLTGTGTVH